MAMVWEKNTCPVQPKKSFSVANFSNLPPAEEKRIMMSLINDSETLLSNTFLPTVVFDKEEVIMAARSAKAKLERLGV